MLASEWKKFLAKWTAEIAARPSKTTADMRALDPRFGFGFPGASEAEIAAAEERLGARLPPSYREFLAATNGLRQPYDYVVALGGDFWGTDRIEWFRVRNGDWVDAYAGETVLSGYPSVSDRDYFVYGPGQDSALFRPEYLRAALEISDVGDSAICLLNPEIRTADGEWEAWFFANWLPGAARYRSFRELMEAHYEGFHDGADGF